jgi:hypothetical protein
MEIHTLLAMRPDEPEELPYWFPCTSSSEQVPLPQHNLLNRSTQYDNNRYWIPLLPVKAVHDMYLCRPRWVMQVMQCISLEILKPR